MCGQDWVTDPVSGYERVNAERLSGEYVIAVVPSTKSCRSYVFGD